jgi:hypothetical protein
LLKNFKTASELHVKSFTPSCRKASQEDTHVWTNMEIVLLLAFESCAKLVHPTRTKVTQVPKA